MAKRPDQPHSLARLAWRVPARRGFPATALLLFTSLALACAGGAPEPPRACLEIEASERLNFYEGKSHVVVLTFFPLRSVTEFQTADVRALIRGDRPAGMTGEAWETTVLPGQELELEEVLPRDTYSLGVVADFNRGPSRAVVEVACGFFGGDRLILSQSDLQLDH